MIFIVGTNGASLNFPTSISEDVIELIPLLEQFSSLTPAAMLNTRPYAVCKFIDNCCEGEDRLKAISLWMSSINHNNTTLDNVINTCTNPTTLNNEDQSCPSLEQINSLPISIREDASAVQQLNSLLKHYPEVILFDLLASISLDVCNDYEFHAFACLSDKTLFESCITKSLQIMYDLRGHEKYYRFIRRFKTSFPNIIQYLTQVSVENKNQN
ncbi:unnamed protein product [Adineta steineri]|uniref:Uncharacterized protein n=1 Tax=Adineta steineri TaxID=433720 RepID=A0A814AXU2_9BILA|nr:unnamed protein product [Adineta steineri]